MTMSIARQSIVPPPFQAFYNANHCSPTTRVGNTIWVSGQVGMGPDMKAGKG
ncbi:hypothetical protein [Paraburkholderia sp. 7MH5]|uniref:hypothetical protein n=1 Tax=Paraburkholderia pallida TaxID=2547399 RepID=UPI0018DA0459